MYRSKVAQVDTELAGFIALLQEEGVRSFLEIGSQYGGSLWRIANALPKGARIVSVDLPWGDGATKPHLEAAIAALNEQGYRAEAIFGDSTDPDIVARVQALGPFDAIFIDGNHTLPVVTKDWENFGPLARIVAFHDIAWDSPVRPGRLPIEVSHLWRSIRGAYRHEQFVAPGSEKGIGVLWRS